MSVFSTTDSHHYLPQLSEENKKRFKFSPKETQIVILKLFQRLERAISLIEEFEWLTRFTDDIMRKFASRLLLNDFILLRDPHDILQGRVEETLLKITINNITDEELDAWRKPLNIQAGKTLKKMTLHERIKLLSRGIEEGKVTPELAVHLTNLEKAVPIRNALVHSRQEELDTDKYVEAVYVYCEFLSIWDLDGRNETPEQEDLVN